MSHATLPCLAYLRAAQGELAATQAAVSGQLIDFMIAQHRLAPQLQREARDAARALLPRIEALLGARPELAAACCVDDAPPHERLLAAAGDAQRELIARGTPEAHALCKALAEVESRYSRALEAAVLAQAQASAAQDRAQPAARNARAYDEAALLAFVHNRFPRERGARIVDSGFVSGGYSKFTIGLTLSGTRELPGDIILRGDAAATFGGASVVDEYHLLRALHQHGVHVPEPLAVEDSGAVFGSPFMLVARRPGRIVGGPYIDPPHDPALCEDIATRLAAIHRVPLAALWPGVSNAGRRNSEKTHAWLDEAEAAWQPLAMPSPVMSAALAWLRRHADITDAAPQALVHGDYGLHNLLVEDGRVSTILDWEFAHVGNPAYDLGYFHFHARHMASWERFLQAYARAGMPVPERAQLDYQVLFAATRIGVMLCQALHAFSSGAEIGLAGAAVLGGNYYERSIARIAEALERVL
ncbi:phosphotransferase family protein [Piscinibacter sp.]|uniref:phosphotransferase family protein n=1 Tax=Piscinibacter sp. TaxID=1903157 RepID=UPI0039E5E88D